MNKRNLIELGDALEAIRKELLDNTGSSKPRQRRNLKSVRVAVYLNKLDKI